MLATGDSHLHTAFVQSDGVNVCIRYLRKSCMPSSESGGQNGLNFLLNRPTTTTTTTTSPNSSSSKLQASCLSCLCHVFYWNKDIRLLYLFEMDFYKLILKCLFATFSSSNTNTPNSTSSNAAANTGGLVRDIEMQEDSSCILFMLLFNQVSSLDYYYYFNSKNSATFDLSAHLKENYCLPFNMSSTPLPHTGNECEISVKLNSLLKSAASSSSHSSSFLQHSIFYHKDQQLTQSLNETNSNSATGPKPQPHSVASLKSQLDAKFRLCWHINWHGGTLATLCHDLTTTVANEQLVATATSQRADFHASLCLTEWDKQRVRISHPYYVFKELCANIHASLTHEDALHTLDLIQVRGIFFLSS